MDKKAISYHVVYSSFKNVPGACPHCKGKLTKERHPYAVLTRNNEEMADTFIMGGDYGWFCEGCSTVVIDHNQLGKMLKFQKSGWNIGSEYRVLGYIDLDAVDDNRPISLDDPELPIIKFIGDTLLEQKNQRHIVKRKLKKQKKSRHRHKKRKKK